MRRDTKVTSRDTLYSSLETVGALSTASLHLLKPRANMCHVLQDEVELLHEHISILKSRTVNENGHPAAPSTFGDQVVLALSSAFMQRKTSIFFSC